MFLSIITINRNNAAGLKKTLESVRSQNFKDFEHIIIDGASSDDSVDIIKEFLKDEDYASKITYWCSEPDNGVYNAMNKGISYMGDSKYCLMLNSGDFFVDSNVISKIFSSNLQEDIVYFDSYQIHEKGIMRINYPEKLTSLLYYVTGFNHQSTLVRTSIQKENLFKNEFKIVNDSALFFHLLFDKSCTTKHKNFCITYYDCRDGLSKSDPNLLAVEQNELVKRYFPFLIQKDLSDYSEYLYSYKGFLRLQKRILDFLFNPIRRKRKLINIYGNYVINFQLSKKFSFYKKIDKLKFVFATFKKILRKIIF